MPCPDIEICKTYVSEAKFIHQCKGLEKFEDCLSFIWRRNPESKTPKEWSEQEIRHIHCLDCDKNGLNPQVCTTCKCVNTNKEEIFANADNSDYIHGETFETHFIHIEQNYESIIGTQKRWNGTVKITIEPVPCVEWIK